MSLLQEYEPIQRCVVSVVLTLQRSLVDLIQIEIKLIRLTAQCANYRKQLHIAASNSLPSFVTDDFPDLEDLLASKLMKNVEKIQEEIDEILRSWMETGEQIHDRSQELKSSMTHWE